jgi:TldD protein
VIIRNHAARAPLSISLALLAFLLAALPIPARAGQGQAEDSDQTLRAMRDEMARSRARLTLAGLEKPYYIEYRLLDLDVRTVTASFGELVSSTTGRNRFMSVEVRVGDHHLDSSNFVSDEGFQGFLGNTGQVGIDRDYNSLRQDLWLATDQAYKQALDQMARKRAFLRSLAKPPEIDDFSQEQPVVLVEPHAEPDWTTRNWEEEARSGSSVLRGFPDLYSTRVSYHLIYETSYLLSSEGMQIRVSHHLAAIEASLDTQADDGMSLHNFYATYAPGPADLPATTAVSKELEHAAQQLEALRASPLAPDYVGPVLFDARAAASLLVQAMGPSLSGARPPLSMLPVFDEMMERMGGRSEWSGRIGTRVLPQSVSLVDDPTAKEFQGQALLGSYQVDAEGVRGQRVALVENGILRNLLMSRRPGPDFDHSNGHGRATLLSEPRSVGSNLFFQSSETLAPADLRKKFLDLCRADGHQWCLEVKRMDNPTLASQRQEDFSDTIASIAGGLSSGDRLPLLVYRVYLDDGREELVRAARFTGLTLRSLRNIAGIGADYSVFNFMQNPAPGFAGTALGAFGSAQSGLPTSIVAPSLLFEEVEERGFHGEPRRTTLIPPPPLR